MGTPQLSIRGGIVAAPQGQIHWGGTIEMDSRLNRMFADKWL